jgi:hypothetical protein
MVCCGLKSPLTISENFGNALFLKSNIDFKKSNFIVDVEGTKGVIPSPFLFDPYVI